MIDFVLLFLGATLIYAGVLMGPQDFHAGIASGLIGVCLSVRPLIRLSLWGREFGGIRGRYTVQGRQPRGRPNIRIVKRPGEDEEHTPPTYH